MTEKQKAILVFRSAALGDFILASPALAMLRRLYPGHRIVLLSTESANRHIRASVARYSPTDSMPWVRLAMPHLVDEIVPMEMSLRPAYLWSLRLKLRSFNVESAFLLLDPGAPWSGRVKKLLMLSVLIGAVPMYGWRARGSLNGDRAALFAAGLLPHHALASLHFMSELHPPRHYTEAEISFELKPPAESLSWAEGWIQRLMPVGKRLVFIAPGSIQPHKRWPLEKFAALVSALLSEFDDLFFVIIGTATDQELGEDIRRQHPDLVVNIAGTTSIAQSAALLRRDCLLVGNDGGAMHLGDAMGCKVVSIVPGIQYPNSIEPWHNRHLAVRHEVPCAPCYSFVTCPLGHNRCMRELPLQAVLNSCRTALTTEPLKGRIVYTQTLQP